jgi:hypothetical protein
MARRRIEADDDRVRIECERIAFMFRVLATEAKSTSTAKYREDFLARAGELVDSILDGGCDVEVRANA